MRWGAGAGASRLISGNMTPHRRLEERLADFKGYEAALLFGSGYLANTGTIAALAGRGRGRLLRRAQPRQHHRRLPAGAGRDLRLPPRATSSTSPGGCARRGGRGSLIVTDGVFSMDGDVAPLADLARLARDHGCRLMVDEAHATGALGPGGRGSVAAAGPAPARSTSSSARSARRSAPTAPTSAPSDEIVEYLLNTRPPLHLLDRAAAARRRRGRRGAGAARSRAAAGRAAARATPPSCARRSPPRASRSAARETQIVPVEVGDAERDDGALRARPRARRLRPGDPPADRPRGLLAPALHGDGHPPRRSSCGAAAGDRRRRGARAGHRRPRAARPARSPLAA